MPPKPNLVFVDVDVARVPSHESGSPSCTRVRRALRFAGRSHTRRSATRDRANATDRVHRATADDRALETREAA